MCRDDTLVLFNQIDTIKIFLPLCLLGIVGVGAALHFMVKPVDKKYFEKGE